MPHLFSDFGYISSGYWLHLIPQAFGIKELALIKF